MLCSAAREDCNWALIVLQDMEDINPEPMYTHMVTYLRDNVPDLAYLHLTEPRVTGGNTLEYLPKSTASIDFIREIWTPRPLISAGGYDRASATERADKNDELIAFGRLFISNVSDIATV